MSSRFDGVTQKCSGVDSRRHASHLEREPRPLHRWFQHTNDLINWLYDYKIMIVTTSALLQKIGFQNATKKVPVRNKLEQL